MSRLHILAGSGVNSFQCALHETVPAGNNAAGVPWSTALVNSGVGGRSIMAVGSGAGQITQAEMDQIIAGTLYEVLFTFQNDPNWTQAQRNAAMDTQIATLSAETQTRIASSLRLFGLTRG